MGADRKGGSLVSQKTRDYYASKYKTLITMKCASCGEFFFRPPCEAVKAKFCSQKCNSSSAGRKAGKDNPNWRGSFKKCVLCGTPVKNRKASTKYCSRECFQISGTAPVGRKDKDGNRYPGAVDKNQEEIVLALKDNGIGVMVMSSAQMGVPDLIASSATLTAFLEVKNPLTSYGRKGLSRLQRRFADVWAGQIYVVTSPEEALAVFDIGDGVKPADVSAWPKMKKEDQEAELIDAVARAVSFVGVDLHV